MIDEGFDVAWKKSKAECLRLMSIDRVSSEDLVGSIAGLLVARNRVQSFDFLASELPYAVHDVFAEYGLNTSEASWAFAMAAIILGFNDVRLPGFLSTYEPNWQAGVGVADIVRDMVR